MGSGVGRLFIIIFRRLGAAHSLLQTKTTRYNYPQTHQPRNPPLMISKTEMGPSPRLYFLDEAKKERRVLTQRSQRQGGSEGEVDFSQKFFEYRFVGRDRTELRLIASGRSITPPSPHIPRQFSKVRGASAAGKHTRSEHPHCLHRNGLLVG